MNRRKSLSTADRSRFRPGAVLSFSGIEAAGKPQNFAVMAPMTCPIAVTSSVARPPTVANRQRSRFCLSTSSGRSTSPSSRWARASSLPAAPETPSVLPGNNPGKTRTCTLRRPTGPQTKCLLCAVRLVACRRRKRFRRGGGNGLVVGYPSGRRVVQRRTRSGLARASGEREPRSRERTSFPGWRRGSAWRCRRRPVRAVPRSNARFPIPAGSGRNPWTGRIAPPGNP